MINTREKIAAGLEDAFAENGFAEIGVDGLREATQVSLRTLYKYYPSREEMVLAALERRHKRYLENLFNQLPAAPEAALDALFDRVGKWMSENAPQGCMFHSAVAAYPDNPAVRGMLERHKKEVSNGMVQATGLTSVRNELMLVHEGITQCWPLMGECAITSAKALLNGLLGRDK